MKKHEGVVYHYGYYRIAKRLRLVRYGALMVFLLFTLILFFAFRQDMTMNHFRYLLRNIDFGSNATLFAGDTIYYNGDSESEFGFVSGGLACLSDTRVFVTDRASGTALSQYHGYEAPRAAFSDKYMAVYDRSGSSLSVFNAFSLLKTFDYDGTVLSAAVADDGTIAVAVGEEDEYYSTVYVYNSSFELENKLSKYRYVTSLALSSDGEYLAVGSLSTGKYGETISELIYLEVGKKKETARHEITDEMLWQVSFFENGSFAALTDQTVLFFDDDGDRVKRISYPYGAPCRTFFGEEGLMLVFSGADARYQTISLYDEEGDLLTDAYALDGEADSIAEDDRYYYLSVGGTILTLNKKGKDPVRASLPEQSGKLVSNGVRVYYATPSFAKALDRKEIGR